MRHKRGSSFACRRRRSGRFWRVLLLAALVLLVLAGVYGCAVQKLVYSARGMVIFLPSSALPFY